MCAWSWGLRPQGCCTSGWVSNLDSQQDLTIDELSGVGYWNDNDMLTVPAPVPVPALAA